MTIALVLSVILERISSISGYHSDPHHRCNARRYRSQIHAGGPQRIVRRRHQHLVAIIQQRGQRQVDELADAIAGEDIIDGDVRNILELCILHDGFACENRPLDGEYPSVSGSCCAISYTTSSGVRNPNGAGLPILSFRICVPAASMRAASSATGPRTS